MSDVRLLPEGSSMSAPFTFTDAQEDNLRTALGVLRSQSGDWFAVANALGVSANSLQKLLDRCARMVPAMAFRIAAQLDQPVDEVVNGVPFGRCPTCNAALRRPLHIGNEPEPPTLRTPRPEGER
jgi:hypothetical protein